MPEIALTGAGGLVGHVLLRRLVAEGRTVRAHLGPVGAPAPPTPPGVQVRRGDVRDPDAMAALVDGVEAVIHVAGPPSVAASFADPVLFAAVHGLGTAVVAQACRQAGVRRLAYVSSAEIAPGGRVDEDTPDAPASPYAAAKRGAELLLATLADPLEVAVVRPSLVVGPVRPRGVFAAMAEALDRPAVALADPDVVRDLLWVEDLADLLLRAVSLPLVAPYRLFVAGSGRGIRLGDLAARLHRLAGGSGAVIRTPLPDRPAPPLPTRVVVPARAAAELGWTPTLTDPDDLAARLYAAWSSLKEPA